MGEEILCRTVSRVPVEYSTPTRELFGVEQMDGSRSGEGVGGLRAQANEGVVQALGTSFLVFLLPTTSV